MAGLVAADYVLLVINTGAAPDPGMPATATTVNDADLVGVVIPSNNQVPYGKQTLEHFGQLLKDKFLLRPLAPQEMELLKSGKLAFTPITVKYHRHGTDKNYNVHIAGVSGCTLASIYTIPDDKDLKEVRIPHGPTASSRRRRKRRRRRRNSPTGPWRTG